MFKEYDNNTGGLHKGQVTCIAARPSTGKSMIALQMATDLAKQGFNVGFNSLEMGAEEHMERIITRYEELNHYKLITGIGANSL